MKEYKLTDEQRKMLMGFIGETVKPDREYYCYGKIRGTEDTNNCHCFIEGCRTFDTDSDMMAVRKALRDKRLWKLFYYNALNYIKIKWTVEYMFYLDKNPERFCWLVAKFLEERK